MVEKKWCSKFLKIMENLYDHDSREKVLISMLNLIEECRISFSNNNLIQILNNLKQEYTSLILKGNGKYEEEYFIEVLSLIEKILEKIKINNKEL